MASGGIKTPFLESGLAEGPWSLTDHGKKAEIKLKSDPYDLDSWGVLLREAQGSAPLRARMMFERLVSQFPMSVRHWRVYIEHEMKNRNYEQVEKLFQRCLMPILHVDLWRCYVSYVRETKASLASYRTKLRQAYEFALDHIGIDFHSSNLWIEYIDFLKAEEAQGSYAENVRTQFIRKAYQTAISSPKHGIESFWRDYNTFEHAVHKLAAKKLVDDQVRVYVNIKRASHEYETISRGLVRGNISVPLKGTPQEIQQLQVWRRLLAWEKQNPTRSDDRATVVKRVIYVYNQCLLCFSFLPDMWYEATLFLQRASESGDSTRSQQWIDEATTLFSRAVAGPMKTNLLINFAYADFEESNLRHDKAESIYAQLIECKGLDPTLFMKFSRRTGGIKAARTVFKKAREDARCKYQAYVAAALMEYYITKDKDVAFRVFELGIKRFGSDAGYLLAYLDHISHLNEDNNTRVLFEKALSSVSPDNTSEIWEKFTSFEANSGNLLSLMKLERRRAASIQAKESKSVDCLLLVDRYRYLDLFPCSPVQLRLMGYSVSAGSSKQTSVFSTAGVSMATNMSSFAKPDVNQMCPFKPSNSSGVGMNAVPGGHFPLPSSVANLLSLLPPPDCFQGPFVVIDELIELVMRCSIPDVGKTSSSLSKEEVLSGARKRGRDDVTQDDVNGDSVRPTNDIYISRQQKRAHNQAAQDV